MNAGEGPRDPLRADCRAAARGARHDTCGARRATVPVGALQIPEIIQRNGKHCLHHIADRDEYLIKLKEKLHEEAAEFTEDPCLEEAADVITVFTALLSEYELDLWDVIFYAVKKKTARGAFTKKIILDAIDE